MGNQSNVRNKCRQFQKPRTTKAGQGQTNMKYKKGSHYNKKISRYYDNNIYFSRYNNDKVSRYFS